MASTDNPYYKLMDKLSQRSVEEITKVFSAVIDMALRSTNKEAKRLYLQLKDPSLCKEEQEAVSLKYTAVAQRQSKLTSIYYCLTP